MASILTDLQVSEVSLVDNPANSSIHPKTRRRTQHAKIALFKRDADCGEFSEICKGTTGIKFVIGFPKDSGGSKVQSVIFDKGNWAADKAKAWLKDHDFVGLEVDETEESLRFRQEDPGGFVRFRTITPGEVKKQDQDQENDILAAVRTRIVAKMRATRLANNPDKGESDLPNVLNKGADDMTLEDIEKRVTEQDAQLAVMKAENDALKLENEAVLKMSKKERGFFAAMPEGKRKEFMSADEKGRAAIIAACDKAAAAPAEGSAAEEEEETGAEEEEEMEMKEKEKAHKVLTEKVAASEARVAKAEQQLADISKRERLAKFAKRAEDELPHTSGSAIEKGERLMKMADGLGGEDSEDFAKVLADLKAADKALSLHYGEVGKAGGRIPAEKMWDAKVQEIAKRDGISEGKATAKAMSECPEVYLDYERQHRQFATQQ